MTENSASFTKKLLDCHAVSAIGKMSVCPTNDFFALHSELVGEEFDKKNRLKSG
jgi:hypothetical protein